MPTTRRNPLRNPKLPQAPAPPPCRGLVIGIGLVVVVGAGLVHGLRFDRWKPSEELVASAARLNAVPMELADWVGEQAPDMTPEEYRAADIAGYIHRRYVHRRTKTELSLLIVCGKPGPVMRHTPDVCYPGAGYEMGRPTKHAYSSDLEPTSAEFFLGKATGSEGHVPDHRRIYWAWGAEGAWAAPESRWKLIRAYTMKPAIYKLYVTRRLLSGEEPVTEEIDFLKQLLPELQQGLFAASGPAATGS